MGAAPLYTRVSGTAMIGSPSSSVRPLTWWQLAHWAAKRSSPAAARLPSSGGDVLGVWLAFQVSKSSGDRAMTSMRMLAWESPQNSAHWPA